MSDLIYLAWRHVSYHRLRSITLVLAIFTLITIPLLAEVLTRSAEARMMARAETTPLVYGAAGAPLDLTLSAVYFRGNVDSAISMQDYDWLIAARLADLAPVHIAGTAGGYPIVGTDLEYFFLRNLQVAEGRLPTQLGEAVVGADVAGDLGLKVGDVLASDVHQAFDLAGAYPVGMVISGILARENTADDTAVLTDLKTGWIVSGLGHGHEELNDRTDPSVLLRTDNDAAITANAALPTYPTISAKTPTDFHFHGEPAAFPLSAVLVFPNDARSAALLQGRVADQDRPIQILRAPDQIRGLMDNVFQVTEILRGVMLAVSFAALLAMGLVVWLSVQMRQKEFDISRRIGAGPGLPAALVVTELAILVIAASLLCAAALWAATYFEESLSLLWILGD